MKAIINPHPRLATGVEIEIKNLSDMIQDTVTFVEASLEKSVEEAKLYIETFYPTHKVEDRCVQLSDGK